MCKKIMKITSKVLLGLLAFVVVVALVAYLTINYWVGPLVGRIIPQVTQTTASLVSTDISLFKGKVSLKGLVIGNPKGFDSDKSFKLDEFTVQFQPKTVLSDKIIVDQVLIKGTQISAEMNSKGQMNLLALNDNVQAYLGTGSEQPEAPKAEATSKSNKAPKTVVIKDLQILDTSVRFGVMGRMTTLNLPNIQEKNIGEKKKVTLKESFVMLLNKLTVEPVQELTKAGQKALTNVLDFIQEKQGSSDSVKLLKNSLSHLF